MKILVNKVQCQNCLDIIESKFTHHFVTCKCFRNDLDNLGIAIDGGHDYLKRSGNINGCIDLSEFSQDEE